MKSSLKERDFDITAIIALEYRKLSDYEEKNIGY